MKINRIFRAYDIRGVYPQNINEEVVFKTTKAFLKVFPGAKSIVLARDARLSGLSLSKAIASAIKSRKRKLINLGLAPDPIYSFATHHYSFDAGIMITASHNPKEYNGLGLDYKKKSVIGEKLAKIGEMAEKEKESFNQKQKLASSNPVFYPEKEYLSYILPMIELARPLKVVIDPGNGAMGLLAEKAFKMLGCEAKTIFAEPDGNFPNHLPDPYLDENLKAIKKEVIKNNADLGFAFDGDGDRVVLIDNKGRRVKEDYCLLFLAKNALAKHKGPIVHDARISNYFLSEMKKLGAKTYFSACHHNAIVEKIKKTKAVFGGEITTHYYFPKDYYLADDGLFSALKLAEATSGFGDFASYLDSLPKIWASPEIFVPIKEEEKFGIAKKLEKILKKRKMKFIDVVDGARINLKNGWILIRYSNTSPLIKIRFEGNTKKDLKEVENQTKSLCREIGIKYNK